MRRREFISLISVVAACPLVARAQQSARKVPVVGVLWHAGNAEEEDVYLSVLRKAFNDLGYVEGKNIRLEHRYPAEQPERFRILARELVDSKPDVIIGVTGLAAVELKKLTSTIPIVFILAADPVGFGLVESLARPGGNVTGLSPMTLDLSGKRLSLLKEAVPHLSRVAFLVDPTDPFRQQAIRANQAAADALGISFQSAEIGAPDDVEQVFAKFAKDHVAGVVWATGSLLFNLRERIGASTMAQRLPAVVSIAVEVPYNLLMSYGQDLPDFFRRAATYTDKILKGARPVDLPVEQPTKFKLVVNLKTAKALGITVPHPLLAQADELIE